MSNQSLELPKSKFLKLKRNPYGERLQGVFTLKDQTGFPIDMSYEIASANGIEIDWVEALADALRQSVDKCKSLCSEMKMLIPDQYNDYKCLFITMIGYISIEKDLCETAELLYQRFHSDNKL